MDFFSIMTGLLITSLLLHLIGQCVGLDLLHHGQQTIGARRREVIAQSYLVDELKVGVEDLLGRVVAQHLDE